MNELAIQLNKGIKAQGVDTDSDALMAYLAMLQKWNKAYNLTAIRQPSDMVTKHLLDSLSVASLIGPYENLLDVGTGAGLPGIPLAITFPQKQFTLLDSNGKKTRFLVEAKRQLGLSNVVVQQARVESFTVDVRFDCILSRAFSSIHDMMNNTQHLLAETGRFLAMKGAVPTDELVDLKCQVHALNVPGLDAMRHAVII